MIHDITRATSVGLEIEEELQKMFEYQSWDDVQKARGRVVRAVLIAAVREIINNVPPSPDRSTAIRKLREARMDCNSAISHNGAY